MKLISKSGLETYFTCPRKYFFKYIQGYESIEAPDESLTNGLTWHDIVENHHTGKEVTAEGVFAPLFEAYKNRWPEKQFTHAELSWELPDIGFRGVFDGLIVDESARRVQIWEHKTTKLDLSYSGWYFDKLPYDWQVGIYQIAAQNMYPGYVISVMYNVTRLPQLKKGKKESEYEYIQRVADNIAERPDSYFARKPFRWSEPMLTTLRGDLMDVYDTLTQTVNVYPRSRQCYHYGRPCEYYPVCHSQKSLTDETLYRIRSRV